MNPSLMVYLNFRMAIVITDGQSRYPDLTSDAAKQLRETGVTIFAIGIKVCQWTILKDDGILKS